MGLLSYVANNTNFSIIVDSDVDSTHIDWNNSIICEYSNIKFYIIQTIDGSYQATGLYNNMRYSIKYNNYEELINVLNGIREIEK